MIKVPKTGLYRITEVTVPTLGKVHLRSEWIILHAMYTLTGNVRLLLLVPETSKEEGRGETPSASGGIR